MSIFKRVKRTCLQQVHKVFIKKQWNDFVEAAKSPEQYQKIKIQSYLSSNVDTHFGKAHDFSKLKTLNDYQKAVPLMDYEKISPWISRLIDGEERVLTNEPVKIFERTSGSTSANKFIPYTNSLLKEFSASTAPWQFNIYENNPNLMGTGSYWSLSQVAALREKTKNGINIGFQDDSEYLIPIERWAFNQINSVSSEVAREPTHEKWEFRTLISLLEEEDLGFLSVWSPTFAIALMTGLKNRILELVPYLSRSRARILEKSIIREKIDTVILWPKLRLISTWADGPSAPFIPMLKELFPHAIIQPKGLMATEGVISFPLWNRLGCVAAINSHFLEFLPAGETERTVAVHELERGGIYSPVMTTGGGLYRYHLKDNVKCVGNFERLPMIVFEQKLDRVSDMVGEKLNGQFVFEIFKKIKNDLNISHSFALLVPLHDEISYRLYLECDSSVDLERLASLFDERLSLAHHYGYARKMGQLKALSARRVENGQAIYENHLVSLGIKRGNIKPTLLETRAGWNLVFKYFEVPHA
jgi:hypothetical protein